MEINSGNRLQQNMPGNDAPGFVWPAGESCAGNPHRPECKNRPAEPIAGEMGYVDNFCDCHDFREPIVHRNGTDISWPRGWTKEDAMRWRAERKLLAVGG
jgi:hypothetical protein